MGIGREDGDGWGGEGRMNWGGGRRGWTCLLLDLLLLVFAQPVLQCGNARVYVRSEEGIERRAMCS